MVEGSCVMFRGEFLGLSLFCYTEPIDDGPQARAGFASLKRGISRTFGPPSKNGAQHLNPLAFGGPGLSCSTCTASNAAAAAS
jgi:hypothetical protein